MADINALLAEADEQIASIEKLYEKVIHQRSELDPDRVPVKIKNAVENQRAALDYLAFAITEIYGKPSSHTYYPVARSYANFKKEMGSKMKGVAASRPDIMKSIQRHQQYNGLWLRRLVILSNENKHRRLSLQRVTTHTGSEPVSSTSARTHPNEATVAGVPVWMAAYLPHPAIGLTFSTYVDWAFTGVRMRRASVVPILRSIQDGCRAAIAEIAQTSGLAPV
jgi:hypothetical protein